ncbi:methylenetetrahydrofolate reductase [Nocardia zapadnayensis]|uniref:methylenetetrahydrofolate reductase n=1 Tax=Nocardia rhamnosiphila TaxID=426716 RepID=UPI0022473197|nr:methylenetetrahydrofolate reductase [Nocardia zapadnayensis]MCX0275210.1 methylenetetrahydrofolate reductase [Nocardia zapadnayensis]
MTSIPCENATPVIRERVIELIASASFEIIPLKGADSKVRAAAPGATVTITCSPRFGLERTLEQTAAAVAHGYRVVPHLAARMVENVGALRRFIDRITDLGVDELFVIGGDAAEPLGRFDSAGQVLDALADFDHSLRRVGVGCYPEGHPEISDAALLKGLLDKQLHADYMVSQLCFDGAALLHWIDEVRAEGVRLPLRVGLAAPIKTARLVELSLKIGVGQSIRYLTKQHGMVGGLLLGRTFAPETILLDMGERLAAGELGIEGVHMFTFNQVDVTAAWQRRIVAGAGQ